MKQYIIRISDKLSHVYEEIAEASGHTTETAIEMTLYKVMDILYREYEKGEQEL